MDARFVISPGITTGGLQPVEPTKEVRTYRASTTYAFQQDLIINLVNTADYIRSKPDLNIPGGRTCTRVSCSWQSAIFVCNDTPRTLPISSLWVSRFTEQIVRECGRDGLVNGKIKQGSLDLKERCLLTGNGAALQARCLPTRKSGMSSSRGTIARKALCA